MSLTGVVGLVYKIKVRSANYEGSVDSNSLSVALASLPGKPSSIPVSDSAITNQVRIGVTVQLLDSTNNGGSQITNYEIQYDDGDLGPFSSVFQLSPTFTLYHNVTSGATYRFRYRAKNFNGLGPFSDFAYVLAATVPGIPPAPIYVSSTSTTTTFAFLEPSDLGGSPLMKFKLFVDTL
jgi:hypothetical protein